MKRVAITVLGALLAGVVASDEGMWTLDNFPARTVHERYGVDIDSAWLEKVQHATARIEGGCTGSFVSPEGLVLTNHHCVSRCINQLSTAERNVAADGFQARTASDEVRCEAEQLSVLTGVEEITDRVVQATAGKTDAEANEARKQVLTQIEQQCEETSRQTPGGERSCESVSLYHGGQYFLYRYKRYDDVRLVFVPESDIAAFGGDPDNFNFPRWCLDMAFLRAYENGQPARTPHFLKWRREGTEAGEVVFVSGHPGATRRLLTVAELEHLRQVVLPDWLMRYVELRGRLIQFSRQSEEAHRIAQSPLLRYENGIKVQRNRLQALLEGELLARKAVEERELQAAVAASPAMQEAYGTAWGDIAKALAAYRTFRDEHVFVEGGAGFNSDLFAYARDLVRVAAESRKPNQERLREYTESALPQLKQRTLAARPIYPDLEQLTLSFSLEKMREFLGPDSPMVRRVLGAASPEALAAELVAGSRLDDPQERERLWDAGLGAIEASDDPMIRLALKLEPDSRALRKRYEDEVEAPQQVASEKIAKARFSTQGTARYPDATFTLRVTFGTVAGWEEKGEQVAPFTTMERLFERTTGSPPFRLPPSWVGAKASLDLATRFNLVATTDIIGGNSGSPMIDRRGDLVGLVFDGNIHSIAGDYWFDERNNRTVAVHPAVMLEALKLVYGAERLLLELGMAGAAVGGSSLASGG